MGIRIRLNADPLSPAARTDTQPHPGGQAACKPILASSRARDILNNELSRYCDGRSQGRSFLVAGHRGSGKTTLIDDAVLSHQVLALRQQVRLKPLPVYVQGPLLFANGGPKPQQADPAQGGARAIQNVALTVAVAGDPPVMADDKAAAEEDNLDSRVLMQIAQGLHQAVSKEFSDRFHWHASRRLKGGDPRGPELAELAARFQIELTEAPPPSRLQEFWHHAGLTEQGLLFEPMHAHGPQQGLREMVALTGISHVYQRISGTLKERDERSSGQQRKSESPTDAGARWADLVKPLSALVTGGAVSTASAGAGRPGWALLLGLAGALGAWLVFSLLGTSTQSGARKLDRTFVPDLKIKTLHRVMPELFDRLKAAGLAPVFIVDELDKVDNLYGQIYGLLDNMKKLFAERAFTCLLVDRGFFEELHWREEQERRGAPQDASAPA